MDEIEAEFWRIIETPDEVGHATAPPSRGCGWTRGTALTQVPCAQGGGVAVRAGPGFRAPRVRVSAAALPPAALGGAPEGGCQEQVRRSRPGLQFVQRAPRGLAPVLPGGGGLQRALLEHQQPSSV